MKASPVRGRLFCDRDREILDWRPRRLLFKPGRWAMLWPMRILTAWLLILALTPASAEVYRWVDPTGQVHYSDQPTPGASPVELRGTSVYKAPKLPTSGGTKPAGASSDQTAQQQIKYTQIEVVSPADDETVRSNEGTVAVSVELRPGLAQGHKLRIFLDGTASADELPTTQITLQNVDRGTHSLAVAVVDPAGKELLRSASVTFHLLRAIANAKKAPRGG